MGTEEARIVIRPAEPRDAEPLGGLHFTCSVAQPGGFMHRLGSRFFTAYYRILLGEPTTVILVADAGPDGLVGLVSATLDSKRQLEAIRRGRLRLLLSVLPVLVRSPNLSWQLFVRDRSLSPDAREEYVVRSGPRIAYWGWRPDYPSRGRSTALIQALLERMATNGVRRVSLETDRINTKVKLIHRMLGARVVQVLTTRDGRERDVLEYVLTPKMDHGTT